MTQFLQKPRILDGDDGLRREVFYQLDLFVGERADFLAIDGDGTDQFTFRKHRDYYQRAGARKICKINDDWVTFKVGLAGSKIVNVHNRFGSGDMAKSAFRMRM